MKTFKQHTEESRRLNKQMTHAADLMFVAGYSGFVTSINIIENLFLEATNRMPSEKIFCSTKIDGSTSIVLGVNPENDRFFVATKSLFNKTPKINYTHEDINRNHSSGLAEALHLILTHGKSLNIESGIYQGDLLFEPKDKKIRTINESKHYVLNPNTISYTTPVQSNIGQEVQAAKIGIAFHTKYTGGTIDTLTANYRLNPVQEHINKSQDGSVFWMFSVNEQIELSRVLSESVKHQKSSLIDQTRKSAKTLKPTLNEISKDKDVRTVLIRYINDVVRHNEEFILNVNDLQKFVEHRVKLSEKKRNHVSEFIDSYKYAISNILEIHEKISDLSVFLVNNLKSNSPFTEYLGEQKTSPEGFVCVDRNDNTIKLIDRMKFAKQNFSNRD